MPRFTLKPAWFQFRLRTLFVVVTLLAAWLGWQLNWIAQRRSYLAQHPETLTEPHPKDALATAPRLLWLLLERAETRLTVQVPGFNNQPAYRRDNPGPEAAEIRALFPEAIIMVCERNVLWYTWKPGTPWDWEMGQPVSLIGNRRAP